MATVAYSLLDIDDETLSKRQLGVFFHDWRDHQSQDDNDKLEVSQRIHRLIMKTS